MESVGEPTGCTGSALCHHVLCTSRVAPRGKGPQVGRRPQEPPRPALLRAVNENRCPLGCLFLDSLTLNSVYSAAPLLTSTPCPPPPSPSADALPFRELSASLSSKAPRLLPLPPE